MKLGLFYPFVRNHNSISVSDQSRSFSPVRNLFLKSARRALAIHYEVLPYLGPTYKNLDAPLRNLFQFIFRGVTSFQLKGFKVLTFMLLKEKSGFPSLSLVLTTFDESHTHATIKVLGIENELSGVVVVVEQDKSTTVKFTLQGRCFNC
ncbi:hypothetical protein H8356DRAFT_970100 [Neocallimastix lanati (nom. inval.)]|nr:hypothetical protein H8356DRAFT_970100 [Neocallimastix sp. JGI-2020a]